ncbi:uncharacterized protein LOC103519002, partial [Diaphorina citri]|uniref:Uncharacterized protein LOC103519002 n=1 Tax=Diaphorina citri TaxID=121845 RepID=A0A1S3DJK8_DIACI
MSGVSNASHSSSDRGPSKGRLQQTCVGVSDCLIDLGLKLFPPHTFRLSHTSRSGKCGHESPCDQLCYELHDGMFECDCKEGFVLHEDGYSCSVENITTDGLLKEDPLNISQDEGEDILYQKDTIFSAKLDALVNTSTGLSTSTGDYVQFVTSSVSTNVSEVSSVDNAKDSCLLECGSGICVLTDVNKYRCQCPLGK